MESEYLNKFNLKGLEDIKNCWKENLNTIFFEESSTSEYSIKWGTGQNIIKDFYYLELKIFISNDKKYIEEIKTKSIIKHLEIDNGIENVNWRAHELKNAFHFRHKVCDRTNCFITNAHIGDRYENSIIDIVDKELKLLSEGFMMLGNGYDIYYPKTSIVKIYSTNVKKLILEKKSEQQISEENLEI